MPFDESSRAGHSGAGAVAAAGRKGDGAGDHAASGSGGCAGDQARGARAGSGRKGDGGGVGGTGRHGAAVRRKGDGGEGGGSTGQSCAGDCCGRAGVAKCGDARLLVEGRGGARALLSGDERLGRGGARALRGVRGRRGGVFGLGAASSEL